MELSKIKVRQVVLLGQLAYLLIQINLLTFLQTLATSGKFVIRSLFVCSVHRFTTNHNTYSNLMYLVTVIIFLHIAKCPFNHARFVLFRTTDFSMCDNSNIVVINSTEFQRSVAPHYTHFYTLRFSKTPITWLWSRSAIWSLFWYPWTL